VKGTHLREAFLVELQKKRVMDAGLARRRAEEVRLHLASRAAAAAVASSGAGGGRADLPRVSLEFLRPRVEVHEKGVRVDHGVKRVRPIQVVAQAPGARASRV
jgi:hypothetical protein